MLPRLPPEMLAVRQLCWKEVGQLVGVVWQPVAGRDSVIECSLTVDREGGSVELGEW